MDLLINDLRFGARLLWKNKGFAATAIATLAICIGVNTAIFSVVHSVVLKPLPFPEVGPGPADVQQLSRRRSGASKHRCPRLLRPPPGGDRFRGAGTLQRSEPDNRFRGIGPAGPRHGCDAVVLPADAGQTAAGKNLHRRGRRGREAAQSHSELCTLAGTVRWRRIGPRQGHPDLRQSHTPLSAYCPRTLLFSIRECACTGRWPLQQSKNPTRAGTATAGK